MYMSVSHFNNEITPVFGVFYALNFIMVVDVSCLGDRGSCSNNLL